MKTYCIVFNEGEMRTLEVAIREERDRLADILEKVEEADILDDEEDEIELKVKDIMVEQLGRAIEEVKKIVPHPAEHTPISPDTKPADAVQTPPKPKDVCSICRKAPHAKWCGQAAPPLAPAKKPALPPDDEPEPEEEIEEEDVVEDAEQVARKGDDKKQRIIELKAGGVSVPDIANQVGCSKAYVYMILKAAREKPAQTIKIPNHFLEQQNKQEIELDDEQPTLAEENDEETSKTSADEDAEPKNAPKQAETETVHCICKQCGNPREEPYGTNPLSLFCPNGFGEDGDQHIYELKHEE